MKTTQNYRLRAILLLLFPIFYSSIIICPPASQESPSLNSLFTSTMPTTSINEQSIDAIYGQNGLNINPAITTQIKQTYTYIETMIKSQKIANDPSLTKDKAFFLTIT